MKNDTKTKNTTAKKPSKGGPPVMACDLLHFADELSDALCQASLDASRLTSADFYTDMPIEERFRKIAALQSSIEHNLLVCFRGVSSLRVLAEDAA